MSGGIALWLAALGSLGTAAGVAIAFMRLRRESKAKQVLRWQTTTVQKIFQSQTGEIGFEAIKTLYRSSASERMRDLLRDKDISDENLREVLIELCRSSVIVQMGGDIYHLAGYLGLLERQTKATINFMDANLILLSKQDGNITELLAQNERLFQRFGAR